LDCTVPNLRLKVAARLALSGPEVASLADEALAARADNPTLFCRVTPQQKFRIIEALRQTGT
jgi:Mg2+-importing ATPase